MENKDAALAEFLSDAQYEFWYPEQTAFVLAHVAQIQAEYRRLLDERPVSHNGDLNGK